MAVFYTGSVKEMGPVESVMGEPLHPYTSTLLSAFPIPDPSKRNLLNTEVLGETPSIIDPPSGCTFHPRCQYSRDRCEIETPELKEYFANHSAACHYSMEIFQAKKGVAEPSLVD